MPQWIVEGSDGSLLTLHFGPNEYNQPKLVQASTKYLHFTVGTSFAIESLHPITNIYIINPDDPMLVKMFNHFKVQEQQQKEEIAKEMLLKLSKMKMPVKKTAVFTL